VKFDRKLEWVLAARWANYKITEFHALPGWDQSYILAAYQSQRQIEAVLAKDQADKQKRASDNKPINQRH